MSRERDYLFNDAVLSGFLRTRRESMLAEIEGYSSDYVLKVSLDDLADHLAVKYQVEPVELADNIEIGERGETQVDVSGDPLRFRCDPSRPCYVKATFATFVIPFEGEAQVFRHQPSTYSTCPPFGEIKGQEIRVRLVRTDHDGKAMRAEFDRIHESIRQYVTGVRLKSTATIQSCVSKPRSVLNCAKRSSSQIKEWSPLSVFRFAQGLTLPPRTTRLWHARNSR